MSKPLKYRPTTPDSPDVPEKSLRNQPILRFRAGGDEVMIRSGNTSAPLIYDEADATVVKLRIWRCKLTGGLQLEIGDGLGGFRLTGPKFIDSELLLEHTVDDREAARIHEYLSRLGDVSRPRRTGANGG